MIIPVGDNVLRRTFPIMPMVLIAANVLVFAYQFRVQNSVEHHRQKQTVVKEFLNTWALVPAKLEEGEVIGVLTHMFMHGGLGHLIGNMFFLWAFSLSLEAAVGRWTLLGFYLLFGAAGGLAHAAADLSSELPLIGASGAIAGFMGAYMVMFGFASKIKVLWFIWFTPIKMEIPAIAFGGVWFGLQVLNSELDVMGTSGVAWYAHIGGFLAGAAIMAVCKGDADCAVVTDGHGNVLLESVDETAATSPLELDMPLDQTEGNPYQLPDCCPECLTAVTSENQIESLLRCPNPDCQKLTFLPMRGEAPTHV